MMKRQPMGFDGCRDERFSNPEPSGVFLKKRDMIKFAFYIDLVDSMKDVFEGD